MKMKAPTINWEFSISDIIKIIVAAGAIIVGVANLYRQHILLTDRVDQHGKKIEQHDSSINKLTEVSVRQQTLLEQLNQK